MRSILDILFINPNSSVKTYQGLAGSFAAVEPPIWAAMLAQHCRRKGYRVDLIDACALDLSDDDVAHTAQYLGARLVCFVVYGQQPSASTQNMAGAVSACKVLKKFYPNIKTLFVGGHVSALPLETLKKHECIDMVCTNEGVETIIGLLSCGYDYRKVKGLMFRSGAEIITTPPAPLADLNDFYGMSWDMLPMDRYRTSLWHSYPVSSMRGKFASIYTSLGCPFACSFCMINSPFGGSSFRYWKPELMIDELDGLMRRDIVNLKIADEMFVLNPNHFMKLCELIIGRGYKFNIWCYARVDTVKPQYLETLKKAGVNFLALGIESANRGVKDDVAKTTKVDVVDIVRQIEDGGINVAANYIFGLPKDNLSTMGETLDLALSLNTAMANFYSAMAYPGSKLYGIAKERGWALPKTYSGYSQHSYDCQPLPTEFCSAAEVLEFRDRAWLKYHTNPAYLSRLERLFGEEAVSETIKSTEIKLKRRLLDASESREYTGRSKG